MTRKIGSDRCLILHGSDVDFGPGLEDVELLEGERALVVDDGRLTR